MKVVRIIGNILIEIVLFALIISVSVLNATKIFLEKDLVMGVVKEGIVQTLDKEENDLNFKKEEILNEIFNDKETSNIVSIVIDNFKKYQEDKTNFTVSNSDIEKITSYAFKYKKQINKISNKAEEITDEKLKEILSKENINKLANEIYSDLDSDIGDEFEKVFYFYENVTSKSMNLIMISLIVFFIVILGLINWSFYKWMITLGVCLIISGVIMSILYIGLLFLTETINSVDVLKRTIDNISFSTYIIIGVIEIVVGIILIIIHNYFKNKPFSEQINKLGTSE